jgi:hypothetical protein
MTRLQMTHMLEAMRIIQDAETDLGYTLKEGERRDLLKDNTSWDSATVHYIVEQLKEW